MESTSVSDRDQFDQAAHALRASLRKSRDFSTEIRQALLLKEQADNSGHSEVRAKSRASIFEILRGIVAGVSRP